MKKICLMLFLAEMAFVLLAMFSFHQFMISSFSFDNLSNLACFIISIAGYIIASSLFQKIRKEMNITKKLLDLWNQNEHFLIPFAATFSFGFLLAKAMIFTMSTPTLSIYSMISNIGISFISLAGLIKSFEPLKPPKKS